MENVKNDTFFKTEGCGMQMVPVTKNLVQIAQKLWDMDYYITNADDYLSTVDTSNVAIGMVNIEFGRCYVEDVFPNLPEEFTFYRYEDKSGCRIVCNEQFLTFLAIPPEKQLKMLISSLHAYLTQLEETNAPKIFKLAGWI